MSEPFWISTGDIKQPYVPMGIVTALAGAPALVFKNPDYAGAFKKATDDLSQQAVKMGCNGVVWIHLQLWPMEGPGSAGPYSRTELR